MKPGKQRAREVERKHPRGSERRRSQFVSLLVFALLLAAPARAGDAAPGVLQDIKEDVAVIRKLRGEFVAAAKARTAPATAPVVITLEFPRLLTAGEAWHGMRVTLRRDGSGNWLPGQGRPNLADTCDASGLVLSSNKTALEGQLHVQLAPAATPFRERVKATILLKAEIKEGVVNGQYNTAGHAALPTIPRGTYRASVFGPLPRRSGVVTGEMRAAKAELEEPVAPALDLLNCVSIALAEAEGLDQVACELYRQAHAAALVVRRAVDLPYALEMTPSYRPRWPQPADAPPAAPKLDMDLDLDGNAVISPASGKISPAQASDVLAAMKNIQSHVGRLRRNLERFAGEPADAAASVTVGDACSDPDFGPWFGEDLLPADKDGVNLLGAVEADASPQEWRAVPSWRFVGPLPPLTRTTALPTLPEMIPAPEAKIVVDPGLEAVINGVWRKDDASDDDVPESAPAGRMCGLGDGCVWVPMGRSIESKNQAHLCPPLSVYAVADLNAAEEGTFWAGLNVKDNGALWVEDRLVWTGPAEPDPDSVEHVYRFPLPLRKGPNRIVLRVDRLQNASFFTLRICVRGKPRDARTVAAAGKSPPPPANDFRGWRGDGGGIFPDATPPLAWDLESERNLLWEIPLGNSQATPLILGDRVFVLEDAATLICFDAKTGRRVWRRTNEPRAEDPAVTAEIEALQARAEELAAQIAELGSTPLARRRALEKRGQTPAQAKESLDQLVESFDKQFRDLRALYKSKLRLGSSWQFYISQTFGTPTTDGKHIWFCSNAGVIACYDLDGNRRWVVTHPWSAGIDYTFSPVLAGGRLVVVFVKKNLGGYTGATLQAARYFLAGYDPDTGRQEWTVDTAPGGQGQICGTPAIVRLMDGGERVDVLVTADGSVVRARDGKLLRKHIGARERYGSPLALGDRVVISGIGNMACYDLLMRDGQLGTRLRWHRPRHWTLYDSGDYRLAKDGLLFEYGARLETLDAETGLMLSCQPDVLYRQPLRCYPPLAWANGHLYVGDLGTGAGMKKWSFVPSALTAATAERNPLVLARNSVRNLCASPAAAGDRLYVRQWFSLACMGFTADEGRRYEAETVAREILSTLPPDPACREPPLSVETSESRRIRSDRHAALVPGILSGSWWYVGPVPRDGAPAIRRALLQDSLAELGAVGERSKLAMAGVSVPIEPIVGIPTDIEQGISRQHHVTKAKVSFDEHMERLRALDPPVWKSSLPGAPYREIQIKGSAIPPDHVAYLVGISAVPLPGPMRWEAPEPGANAWVAGREIRHGQLAVAPEGGLSVVIELQPAPDGSLRRLRPCFWPSCGDEGDRDAWRHEVARRRPYLERALAVTEDAALKARIGAVLGSVPAP